MGLGRDYSTLPRPPIGKREIVVQLDFEVNSTSDITTLEGPKKKFPIGAANDSTYAGDPDCHAASYVPGRAAPT